MVSNLFEIDKCLEFPSDERRLNFELISDTDLLELATKKTCALNMTFSNSGNMMAIFCRDRFIRIFNVKTGKLLKTIDETLQSYID